jgi:hypothetical protein
VTHVEQELFTIPKHLFSGVRVAQSLVFCVMFYISFFVLLFFFSFAIVLSVLPRYTASAYLPLVSSRFSWSVTCDRYINKTDCHNIIEILLKVELNTINQPNKLILSLFL